MPPKLGHAFEVLNQSTIEFRFGNIFLSRGGHLSLIKVDYRSRFVDADSPAGSDLKPVAVVAWPLISRRLRMLPANVAANRERLSGLLGGCRFCGLERPLDRQKRTLVLSGKVTATYACWPGLEHLPEKKRQPGIAEAASSNRMLGFRVSLFCDRCVSAYS